MKNSIKYIITRVLCAFVVALSFWFLDTYVVNAFSYTVKEGSCSITEQGSVPARDVDMFITGSCNAGSILTFKLYENGTLCDSGDCTFVTSMVPINKSGLDNNFTPIAYDPFTGVGGRTTILNRFSFFTFAGDTWKYKEYLGGPHDKKSATAYFHGTEFLILNSTIALKFDSTSSFGVALHGDIITSKGVEIITNTYNSTMDNIDLDKMDEQLETSKSIWQTLKDILTGLPDWFSNLANSIGEFFSNLTNSIGEFFGNLISALGEGFSGLFDGIKGLFFGEETEECTQYLNFFNGYSKQFSTLGGGSFSNVNIKPELDTGWFTMTANTKLIYLSEIIPALETNTDYTFIIETDTVSGSPSIYPSYSYNNKFTTQFSVNMTGTTLQSNSKYFISSKTLSDFSNSSYAYAMHMNGSGSAKIRIVLIKGTYTSVNYDLEYFQGTKDICTTTGSTTGLFGILGNFLKSIGDWFNNLFKIFEDTDVSDSTSDGQNFFESFEDKDYGLSDIVSMPLVYIGKITTTTCSPLVLPLPFVEKNATLPCMSQLYREHFGSFLTLYQTITFGIIAYWVCINIFAMVRNFKNPDDDRIEVMDL